MSLPPVGLDQIAAQLATFSNDEANVPDDLIDRYIELSRLSGNGYDEISGELYRTRKLAARSRHAEALVHLEALLQRHPASLILQLAWSSHLERALSALEHLAARNPGEAEYGRTYELLLSAGHASLEVHLGAIHHFRISGQIERAAGIAVKLAAVAPHFIGLRDAVGFLAQVTDDARIHALLISKPTQEKIHDRH